MDSVRDILETQDVYDIADMEIGEAYTVDSGSDAIMDLQVERVYEDLLLVGQYFEQRRDLMADPEIRFNARNWDDWMPVEYRQDAAPSVHQYDASGLGADVQSFVDRFDDNLRNQGFVDRAENGYIQQK